jgi:hypothetical protein
MYALGVAIILAGVYLLVPSKSREGKRLSLLGFNPYTMGMKNPVIPCNRIICDQEVPSGTKHSYIEMVKMHKIGKMAQHKLLGKNQGMKNTRNIEKFRKGKFTSA